MHRPYVFVARYGGEEFCCVLPDTPESGAWAVAQRIQDGLAKQAIPHAWSKISAVVTVSMGIATWKPGTETSLDDILGRSDKALYQAKHSGRNCIVFFIKFRH